MNDNFQSQNQDETQRVDSRSEDDSQQEDSQTAPIPSKSGGKVNNRPVKRAGRRKINIEFIKDKSRRHITFSKRKAGIMKKAYELSTLTGTQVLLLVASETGHVYTFATPKLQPLITRAEGKNLIQSCLNSTPNAQIGQAGNVQEMGQGGGQIQTDGNTPVLPTQQTPIDQQSAVGEPGQNQSDMLYQQGNQGNFDEQQQYYNNGAPQGSYNQSSGQDNYSSYNLSGGNFGNQRIPKIKSEQNDGSLMYGGRMQNPNSSSYQETTTNRLPTMSNFSSGGGNDQSMLQMMGSNSGGTAQSYGTGNTPTNPNFTQRTAQSYQQGGSMYNGEYPQTQQQAQPQTQPQTQSQPQQQQQYQIHPSANYSQNY